MKKHSRNFLIIIMSFLTILTAGCSPYSGNGELERVGMLVEGSVDDQSWGERGYQGLMKIKEEYGAEVFLKEGIQTEQEVIAAVEEFSNQGINLIFGHSNMYGKIFSEISEAYPDIHFVYFNGGYYQENVTSMNFNSHAMGFFAGMVAGAMTKSNKVALIGAFEWQPEIEGFYEGVNYQNPTAEVQMNFLNSWDDTTLALEVFTEMAASGVDVFYPAGDAFSVPVINQAVEEGLYAIGYVADQSNLSKKFVLTSTIQHVDQLYLLAAGKFNNGNLKAGVYSYDFQDGAISLGPFSRDVPEEFRDVIHQAIERYIETGLLPNEY